MTVSIKTSLFFYLLISFSGFTQNIKDDSLRLNTLFSSAIGNIELLDSLEYDELKTILNTKDHYILEDTYWYNLSKARFLSGQIELAFKAANKGLQLNETAGTPYRSAKFFNLKASVYSFKKENEKAIQHFKRALSLVEKNNDLHTAALIRNNIANLFITLSDYKSAYNYSSASYEQLLAEKDTIHLPGVTGVFAITALKLNKLKKGKELAEKSLYLSKKYSSPIGLIVSHHSMGEILTVEKDYVNAIIYFKESLKLSEIYQQSHFIMLNKVGLQHTTLAYKQYAESIEYGEEALKETLQLKNENTLYAIHKNLGYAFDGLGNKGKAFYHLSLAHDYYIESAGIENQKAINNILIKYDTEKKEKELALSQLVNIESQNKLSRRAQWITILGVIIAFLLISYFFYNRLQKHRLLQLKKDQESKRMIAAISAEENERERISNELHNGMASVIAGIKIKLEDYFKNEHHTFLEPVIQQLKGLHDETRRISHNLMPLDLDHQNWIERIQQYCRENSSPSFNLVFINNLKTMLLLNPSVSIILYRSVQELIHNAQKHSEGTVCYVQISQLNKELILSVEDEGLGFRKEVGEDTQGLKSIRKYLEKIGAELEIESKLGKGSLLSIHLKVISNKQV
ncbi:MAG: hypothetical protein COA33_010045 [Fluviicola sp.]|nr:hypothetical protein [Fluviicola sp.]